MGYWNDPEYQRRRRAKGKLGEASMSISRRSWHDPGGPEPGYLQDRTAPAGVRRGISITAADFDRAFNPEERAAVTSTFGGGALEKLEHPVQPFFGERNLAQERRAGLVDRFSPASNAMAMSGLPGDQGGNGAAPVESGVRDVGNRLKGLYTRADGTVGLKEPDETYRSATVMALNEDIARAFGMGPLAVPERREIFRKMIDEDIDRRMQERRMAVLEQQTAAFSGESLQGMMSNPELVQGQVGKSGMSFRKTAPGTPLAEKRAAYKLSLIGKLVGRQDTGEDDAAYAKRVKAAMAIAGEMAAADLPDEGMEGGGAGTAGGGGEVVFTPWSQVSPAQRARIYQKSGIRTEEEYNLAAEQMGYK